MGKQIYRHFLVESGLLLELARKIQDEHQATHEACSKFAKKYGSRGFFSTSSSWSTGPFRIHGLIKTNPLPAGWRLNKHNRESMLPRKDAPGILAEIDALPKFPNRNELVSNAIGWRTDLATKIPEGGKRHEHLPFCQLCWTVDRFLIALPLGPLFGPQNPATIANAMAFSVPAGCREITEAEWALIEAQDRVAAEAAAKAAGDGE